MHHYYYVYATEGTGPSIVSSNTNGHRTLHSIFLHCYFAGIRTKSSIVLYLFTRQLIESADDLN
jgi:hypothetical protein